MSKEEVCERYGIPAQVLDECQRWGLCDAAKAVMGDWRNDGHDLEVLSMVLSLHEIGLSADEVETYMGLFLKGAATRAERMRMLDVHRRSMLNEIHGLEDRLDKIDCLRHETRREPDKSQLAQAVRG